jgi:hypothetical protein
VRLRGIADAAPPSGPGTGDGGPNDPNGPVGGATTNKVFHLPGLEIEIKNTRGDHRPPKIKVVPFPGLRLPR